MASKSTWPGPGERKSQPQRGSPKFRCEPRIPLLQLSVRAASLKGEQGHAMLFRQRGYRECRGRALLFAKGGQGN